MILSVSKSSSPSSGSLSPISGSSSVSLSSSTVLSPTISLSITEFFISSITSLFKVLSSSITSLFKTLFSSSTISLSTLLSSIISLSASFPPELSGVSSGTSPPSTFIKYSLATYPITPSSVITLSQV